jgi:hypothetical protein
LSWEEIRHQVAIAGTVRQRLPGDEAGRAIGSARVRVTNGPAAFITTVINQAKAAASRDAATAPQREVLDDPAASDADKLQAAQQILDYVQARRMPGMERPDQIRTARDGHFHFLDLPDGPYTLSASLPGSGSRYGTRQLDVTVTSSADNGERNIDMVAADMALPPTTLTGQITDQDSGDPVVMAEVRVKESGERTFTGEDGKYVLAGLERGERIVQITAPGYQAPAPQQVDFTVAGEEKVLDLTLEPV